MLQQSTATLNGHAGKHSRANGHAVILGTQCAIGRQVESVENNGVSAPEKRRLPKIKGRDVWADRNAEMERRIQRDTCGLGHWREPKGWCTEPFSHTVTMVTDLMGMMGGWHIYSGGVTVTLVEHPIEGPFTRGAPYVWCKQARNHNGTSGVYPTAPLFGRFIEWSGDRPKVLAGKGKSAVVGAEYVYCYRAVGYMGGDAERYTRSEIPVPIPSNAERLDGPAAFDTLQYAVKRLGQLIENMCDVTDMADELIEGEKKTGDFAEDRLTRVHHEARAYKALQPILNAAMAQSGRIDKELAAYLKTSPSLTYWLARWQAEDAET